MTGFSDSSVSQSVEQDRPMRADLFLKEENKIFKCQQDDLFFMLKKKKRKTLNKCIQQQNYTLLLHFLHDQHTISGLSYLQQMWELSFLIASSLAFYFIFFLKYKIINPLRKQLANSLEFYDRKICFAVFRCNLYYLYLILSRALSLCMYVFCTHTHFLLRRGTNHDQ